MNSTLFCCVLACSVMLTGCGKSTEQQMQEYIEFYYPTTGNYSYDIMFDWGSYLVVTGANAEEPLHEDSEPYRGFIVMRPNVQPGGEQRNPPIYLITPRGDVFIRADSEEIPEIKVREEVVVEKTAYGTSTQTTTIQSPLEPVVDDFRANRDQWTPYGQLESTDGKNTLKQSPHQQSQKEDPYVQEHQKAPETGERSAVGR